MRYRFLLPSSLALFLISMLIVSACAPAVAVDDPEILVRASPTPGITSSPVSLELPVTGPTMQPTLEAALVPARLAVITSRASISRGENEQQIQQAQSADIQVNDQLEIIRLDGQR